MEYKSLIVTKEDGLATVFFNRPEAMNATNQQSIADLTAAITDIEADDSILAVIMTGGEKVFAAGGDIKYFSEAGHLEMEAFIAKCHAVHDIMAASAKPYVAAIGGLALGGGCEMALACDIRIAAESAIFGFPEINIGIIPGAGGTQRLPRVVGSGWARQLVLTGDMIDAKTAFKIGLVTKVVPVEELMATAKKTAKSLAKKSPMGIRSAKKCLAMSETADMPSALAYEQKAWAFCFSGSDRAEGMKAFLEKRKPTFVNR
ncbi:MAG TPA: enoyl-CoA hydratase-related protein [Syntrophomonas sp.]|nr:enoyl-CoA hydratase-related protein [Syntrophomonas sp.]